MKTIEDYDVVVVGGGPGGVGAAVAAARAGARTLVIEREGCLGGGGTTMLVNPFMPYTTDDWQPTGPHNLINAGIFTEIRKALVAKGGARAGFDACFDDEVLKVVLDELVTGAGAEVMFHTALFDAQVQGGKVQSIRVAHNGGPITVTAKVFIDSTGDGLLAALAGCEFQVGDDRGTTMPMTLNFVVGGVDLSKAPPNHEMKKLVAKGDKDTPALINQNHSCCHSYRDGVMHFNAIRVPGNALNPQDISNAEIEGRKRVQNFVAWLRANVPGYEKCVLLKTGSHIGVRETRRVMGDYVLTGDDFKKAAKFDDAIAACAYPVDIHGQKPGEGTMLHMGEGQYYHIPYRCLTPKGMSNLLIAGRSISADTIAHSSLRVMPPLYNVGQAAGIAAAMSLPTADVRKIEVKELQRRIREGGGILEA